MPVQGPAEAVEKVQEEQPDHLEASSEEQEKERQLQRQKEQVTKILSNVKQNFGKINVAPEFNEEDLVPVEMPDLDLDSGSDGEEDGEEEVEEGKEGGEEDGADVEPADGEPVGEEEEAASSAAQAGNANSNKSSREVIRELDNKISKYKHFLDRAKSNRFSAIRSVRSPPDIVFVFL